jgi:hypothetical protein
MQSKKPKIFIREAHEAVEEEAKDMSFLLRALHVLRG